MGRTLWITYWSYLQQQFSRNWNGMHAFFSATYTYFTAEMIACQASIGSVFGSRQGEFISTTKTRPTRS